MEKGIDINGNCILITMNYLIFISDLSPTAASLSNYTQLVPISTFSDNLDPFQDDFIIGKMMI